MFPILFYVAISVYILLSISNELSHFKIYAQIGLTVLPLRVQSTANHLSCAVRSVPRKLFLSAAAHAFAQTALRGITG